MNYKRCDVCAGRKKCVGMGGMSKDCAACKGVGYIADKSKDDKTTKK